MAVTSADELIDRYIDHTDRLIPDFIAAARGASEERIDRLERLIGVRLPQIYRAFVRRFGEHDGTLTLGNDASTGFSEMIEFYEEMAVSPGLHPSPIAIACGGVVTPEIFMDISVHACPVYFDDWSRFRDLYAASFLGLLYRRRSFATSQGADRCLRRRAGSARWEAVAPRQRNCLQSDALDYHGNSS
ncbi:SMI1/KNR4 family protein [Humibacter sp. BT305]|nr:SMI1/KNR4 family protein [Humibacter sp. BT305]